MRFQKLLTPALFLLCMSAFAGDKGSPEEAIAMTKKAVAFLKANGKEKAFAEFNKQEPGPFRDRDLYVMVVDKKGTALAHGGNNKTVGKNLIELRDSDGKPIIKGLIDTAFGPAGKGWVEYNWANPVTKSVDPKRTYVERVDDVLVGVGVYK